MSEEAKSLIRRFYSDVSAGNLGVIDELVADDVIEHEDFPGLEPNKDGVKQFFAMFRAAFPDLRMEADEVISEGDLVCVRGTMAGTHQGEFMGMPATGKRFEIRGFDMVRLRDGQVVEHWGITDMMSMMQQLGAMPEQAPA